MILINVLFSILHLKFFKYLFAVFLVFACLALAWKLFVFGGGYND